MAWYNPGAIGRAAKDRARKAPEQEGVSAGRPTIDGLEQGAGPGLDDGSSLQVFISPARDNADVAQYVAECLGAAGVTAWAGAGGIAAGTSYGPEIVARIRRSEMVLLLCTDAAMRCPDVRQQIAVAWTHQRGILPVWVESTQYTDQLAYWLTGVQGVEMLGRPRDQWLPQVLAALAGAGAPAPQPVTQHAAAYPLPAPQRPAEPLLLGPGLGGLLRAASFTNRVWPVRAERTSPVTSTAIYRDLGEDPRPRSAPGPQHSFPLGSQIRLAIDSDREGHMLVLDQGTSRKVYCLCPSGMFAPETRLRTGLSYLPQPRADQDAFVLTGDRGREHLLVVVTDHPLTLSWAPTDPRVPPRLLSPADLDELMRTLSGMEPGSWTALATHFQVT